MSQSPADARPADTDAAEITRRAFAAMQSLGEANGRLFESLVREVAAALDMRHVFVSEIVDRKHLKVQTRAFWSDGGFVEPTRFDIEGGPCAIAVERGEHSCASRVVDSFPDFEPLRALGAESYLGVRIGGDEPIGHLCAIDTRPLVNVEFRAQMLRLFADRAHQELRRIHERDLLSTQRRVLETIATGGSLDDVLEQLCNDIERQVTGAVCSVMRRRGDVLHLAAGPSIPQDLAKEFEEVAVGRGTCGMAVETGAPVIVPDTTTDPRWQDLLAYVEKYHIQACWSYPIPVSDGRIVGTFAISNSLGGEPTARELEILETAANLASIAMERDLAERHRGLIVNELDHRVKNNLASVLSLAEMSLASAASLEGFGETFTGRVRAMARTHEALAGHDWEAIDVRGMIDAVVEPYVDRDNPRVVVEGDPTTLPANVATPLGMAVHELATNAGKHGALSTPEGTVRIGWSNPEADTLEFVWKERGGPPIDASHEPGVGMRLIAGLIRQEIGGTVDLDLTSEGLTCTIRIQRAAREVNNGAAHAETADSAASSRVALVVEDNFLVGESLCRMLRGVGCEVVGPAGSIGRAEELAAAHTVDIAILDLNIAGESTITLARELRANGRSVVFVSGYSSEGILPDELSDVPRLVKPVTQQALVDAIIAARRAADASVS